MKALTRSAATSIFTTALDIGTLTALVELFHVDVVLATFIGTIVGCTSNFMINRHWAFEATHGRKRWQVVRFLPVQAGSSGLQTLGVWLLTHYGAISYFTSKLIVSIVVYLGWNFPMNRYFVFPAAIRETSAGTSQRAV